MKPVILAAGEGSRIGEETSDLPKWFLEVGGRHIYDYQLEALSRFFDEAIVVLGYGFSKHETPEEIIPEYEDIQITPLFYPDWKVTENAGTAAFALNQVEDQEDLLLICGDIIFDKAFLSSVIADYNDSEGNSAVAAFEGIQGQKTAVALDQEQKITDYGKIEGHEEAGVFILNADHLERAADIWSENPDEWFPIVFPEADSVGIFVNEGIHFEINHPTDLERAERELATKKTEI